jgi:excisionase family DNA binding protein
MDQEVPIAEKALLTIREAADYYNLGLHKLRELTNDEHCPFVLWNGNKRLIKRKAFEEFLNSLYSDLLSLSIKAN